MLEMLSLWLIGKEYPELKAKLENAVSEKDPDALERALYEIDRQIPPGKVPQRDKPLIENARVLMEKYEGQKGMHYNLQLISMKWSP